MSIKTYKELIVWQKSMNLVEEIYFLTSNYPKEEIYGLISQTRRSAISVPSNTAEGRRRGTKKDFQRFLVIAYGSGSELETQLEIAKRLFFADKNSFLRSLSLLDEVMRMLNTMISHLQATN